MVGYSNTVFVWIKTVHVLSAVVWVGGGVFIQVYITRLRKADETPRLMAFAKEVESIANRLFLPASILVLLAGIAMIWYSPGFRLTELWVILGLVGIVNTIVIGAGFLGPEAGRIAAAAEASGPESPEVVRRTNRIFTISRIDLAVLIFVIVMMVTKPTL
jgi:uncharacterized membrane protein